MSEIPDNVKKGLEIIPVTTITEVLSHALTKMPEPIEDKPASVTATPADGKEKDLIHH